MFCFKRSTIADMLLFQKWSEAPSVCRWLPIGDWLAYYHAVVDQDNYFLYSVYHNDVLTAFVAAEIEDATAFLCLVVAPDQQGIGVGTALLQQIIMQHRLLFGDISALGAGIFPENIASIKCFVKANFQRTSLGNDGEIMYIHAL